MTYLLDTHHFLWAITNAKKIPKKLREVLTDPENEIIVSAISFWEISLKSSLGKLEIKGFSPEDLPDICEKIGFAVKSLSAKESCCYHKLKVTYHKDPFDRMLIWQAISNDYVLVSADAQIKKYVSSGLKIYDGH
jgi:PIN domain nuclease of toxin-antitoxin system